MLADADGKLSLGKDVKATVKAEILDHVKGDKVIAFKKKRRKGFRKSMVIVRLHPDQDQQHQAK